MALQTKDFSATGKIGYGTGTYTFTLRVTELSVDTVNNTSRIEVSAIVKNSVDEVAVYDALTHIFCSINGVQKFNKSFVQSFEGKSEHNCYSWTGNIEHNPDGTLAITVGGYIEATDQIEDWKITIAENSNNKMTLTPIDTGYVYISNASSGFEKYFVYIHNGTTFEKYIPYIHNGTSWQRYP